MYGEVSAIPSVLSEVSHENISKRERYPQYYGFIFVYTVHHVLLRGLSNGSKARKRTRSVGIVSQY